jgi:hypothetical protein
MARSSYRVVLFALFVAIAALSGCGKKPVAPGPPPELEEPPAPPVKSPPKTLSDDPAREWDQRRAAKDTEWLKMAEASDKAAAELEKLGVQCSGSAGGCRVVLLDGLDCAEGRVKPDILKLLSEVAIDQMKIDASLSDKGFKEVLDLPGMKWVTAIFTAGIDGLADATFARTFEFRGLRGVRMSGADDVNLTPAAFASLKNKKFPLSSLELPHLGVGDWVIDSLQGATELTRLDLSGNPITDAGGNKLASFKKLDVLGLAKTKIGDATLAALALPELTQLNISETSVTDAGLKSLTACPKLSQLKCDKTKITDAGLLALANCAALEELDASGTPITDAGVKHIAKMPNLSNLTLLRTKVTRESLGVLTSFPNLAMVYLSTRSKITEDDLEELNKKKLKLMIVLVQDDE